jgi:hypothetical protein
MKYLKLITLSIGLLFISLLTAQVGSEFPLLKGESLTNKMVTLPADVNGNFTIIGLAWSKTAEEDLESWLVPVYDLFINKNTFISLDYDANVFFVPLFSGAKKGFYKPAMEKAKKQLDASLAPHVLFYKGDIKEYKEKLALKNKNIPYFFVLDKKGSIVYTTSGKYTEEKLEKMGNFISN